MSFKHQTEGFDSQFSCLSKTHFTVLQQLQEVQQKNELWQHNKKRRVNI